MKKARNVFVSLAVITFFAVFLAFAGNIDMTQGKVNQKVVNKTIEETPGKHQKEISKEAYEGVELTHAALSLLRDDKVDEAGKTLIEASMNMNEAIEGGKDFVLVDVKTAVLIGITSPERAKGLMQEAKIAINENNPRLARKLLTSLVNETEITSIYVPLYSYKNYIDRAVVSLGKKDGKKKAEAFLLDAMNSIFIEIEIIPLAPITAGEILDIANDVVKDDPERALQFVKDANAQLELNKLLGYEHADAYKKQASSIKKRALSLRYERTKKELWHKLREIENVIENNASEIGKKIGDELGKIKHKLSR